jgi:hypothetical protein
LTLRRALWAKRAEGTKAYEVFRKADVNPSVGSALINDIIPIQRDDSRVLRIAAVLEVPAAEAFTQRSEARRR